MRVFTVFGATVLVSIIMNEATSACRFFKVEGSSKRASTVFGEIVLASIIMAISACRFFKVEGSYMGASTVYFSI